MGVRSPAEVEANEMPPMPGGENNNASENVVTSVAVEKYLPVVDEEETHDGVRGIEATTTVWSKKHLIGAYLL